MEHHHQLRRRATRPPLHDYIVGSATLQELAPTKAKMTKLHERHNQKALLACINNMDNRTYISSSNRTRCSAAKTLSTKSSNRAAHSKHESAKRATGSDSLRSAHGDTSESLSAVTKVSSVVFEQQLNDRETEIAALREEITNLNRAHTDVVLKLRRLIENLFVSERDAAEPLPDDCNLIVERLCDGVRTLSLSGLEKDKKIAQFQVNNEQLQKRITDRESDLRQIADLRAQNEKLRSDIETTRKTQLENYEKNLQERAQELQQAFDKLESLCHRHKHRVEIERLQAQIHESEAARWQQVSEVGAELIDYRKQFNELQTCCTNLTSVNRRLRDENKYLWQMNDILEDTYLKQVNELKPDEQLKAMTTLKMRTLDAEKAYSQNIMGHIEELKRVASGSNDC